MRARRYDENDAGGSLGGDVKALRFFATTLARMQAPAHQERPWNVLTQQALDLTALAVLKSIRRCGAGVRKEFPTPEWWRPPIVTPLVGTDAAAYADCQWAVSAGTQVLQDASESIERPQVALRLELLHLIFLRPLIAEGSAEEQVARDEESVGGLRDRDCPPSLPREQWAEHNAQVLKELSTRLIY